MAAWRSGDASAFSEIVRLHHRRLFAVAYHKTGNAESAADAVQVALHNAYRAVGRFNGTDDVGNWLTSIVVNAARDESRRNVRHRRIAHRATESAEYRLRVRDAERSRGDRAHRLELLDLGRILAEGIGALPDPYRRAVELFHVHGMSIEQVSDELATNPNTVKTRLARGRGLLQRSLEKRLREGGYL